MRALPLFCAMTAGAAVALAAAQARASCCGNGYGLGLRLAEREDVAAAASVTGSEFVGSWDRTATYRSLAGAAYQRELRLDASILARAAPRLQVGMSANASSTWKRAGDVTAWGGGPGDVMVQGRFDALRMNAISWAPGVALTLAATIPTGQSPYTTRDPLAADVTGIGTWEVRPGIALEKWWTEWYFAALFSVGLRAPIERDDAVQIAPSPRGQVLVAGGKTWDSTFSVAMGARFEWESAPRIAGVASPNADRRRTTALAVFGWSVDEHWTLTAGAQVEPPFGDVGKNELGAVAFTIGMRRAWLDFD